MSRSKVTEVGDEASVDESVIESKPGEQSGELTIGKYFQLYGSGIGVYQRAYAEERFRGIMKSKESWEATIHTFMEGEK